MANYQELAHLVWNVADDVLRGLFKQHEYGDITLPFLVLRRLDCILREYLCATSQSLDRKQL